MIYYSVEEAIARSQSHNELAHIDLNEFGGGDPVKDQIRTEIENAAEDWSDSNDGREFWGSDDNGLWRVHVRNF